MFSRPCVPPCSVPVACGGPRCRRVELSICCAGLRCDATVRGGIRSVNPNGSGISLGHPIGATGAVITVKALYELQPVNDRYALVTMLHRRRAGHRGGFRKPGPRLRQLSASASFEKDRLRRYAMARGRSFLPIPTTDDRRLEIGRRDRCIYMGGAEDRRLCSDRRHSERCAD